MAGRDDDLQLLEELAERLKLDEKETSSFINSSMQRMGYRPRMDWDEPEEGDEGNNGGDFFSKKEQRRTRTVGGREGQERGNRRASGGGGFGYE